MAPHRGRAGWLVGAAAALVAGSIVVAPTFGWGDATVALSGEGGSFSAPMMNLLQNDPAALSAIAPFVPSFFDADIDQASTDFAMASTDYAVTEIPLTASQAATAAQNGRSFAYVPLAASPVALAAVVECSGLPVLNPATFCPNIELTVPLLARMFTNLPPPIAGINAWNSPELEALTPSLSGVLNGSDTIHPLVDVQPSVANLVMESLFVNNPTTKTIWDAYLQQYNHTTDDTPTDLWPNTPQTVSGGEAAIAQLLVPENQNQNPPLPFVDPTKWGQGSIAPMSPGWTGPPRNIPSVAIQNAAGAFVQPTAVAVAAALQDSTMDPTTNVVTFNVNPNDAAAYPMSVMTYLVVPTTGLDPAKATALAGFIRFLLGSTAQKKIASLGSVPPTQAMVTAGLHVADEVAAESTVSTSTTSSTTSTTGASQTTSTTAGGSSSGQGSGGASSTSTTPPAATTAADSGPSLAFTGGIPWPVPIAGGAMVLVGLTARRVLRLRLAHWERGVDRAR